jgi:HEAT repeat protein
LIDLVRTLAIAWKSLTAYPPGHPALQTALGAANSRLHDALAELGTVSLGVAKDGLLYGDEKLASPHAQGLAAALYRRDVTLLHFDSGLESRALEAFLRTLSVDPNEAARPPLAEELAAAGITHIRIEAADYSALRVTDSVDASTRPPDLWDDLLQALLQDRKLAPEGRRLFEAAKESVSEIAEFLVRMVREPQSGAASETGSRFGAAVTAHLGALSGGERGAALHQVLELVRALPEDIRAAVLEAAVRASASDETSGAILDSLAALAPNAVLQILHHIASEGEALSSHALRVLRALEGTIRKSSETFSDVDRETLVAEMSSLFRAEDIDRFNPEDHEALLERVSLEIPERVPNLETPPELGDRLATVTDDEVAEHLTQTVLELLRKRGPLEGFEALLVHLETLFRVHVAHGRLEEAISIVETLREIERDRRFTSKAAATIQECFGRLAGGDSVSTLIDSLQQPSVRGAGLAQRLIELLGAAAARNFLFALAEESDQSRRRRLFDLLASVGPTIVPAAKELLSDARWFVVRNMILLLRKVADRSSVPELRGLAEHPDLRVRLEAIKSLLAFDPTVPRDLLARAIHDPDPKLAEAAVTLAGTYGIKEAVEPLVEIVERLDLLGQRRALRLKCLRALGELGDPGALTRLGRFFRPSLLPLVALEERRAAFKSLESYPSEARRALVDAGLHARDGEIRTICERLAQQPAAAIALSERETPSSDKELPE